MAKKNGLIHDRIVSFTKIFISTFAFDIRSVTKCLGKLAHQLLQSLALMALLL